LHQVQYTILLLWEEVIGQCLYGRARREKDLFFAWHLGPLDGRKQAAGTRRIVHPCHRSIAQLHASIARITWRIYSTRLLCLPTPTSHYKACRQTILNFGLMDFAALCALAAATIKSSVCVCDGNQPFFEPRLGDVFTSIAPAIDSTRISSMSSSATIRNAG
jgi:predicted component of type VI protein secretion system